MVGRRKREKGRSVENLWLISFTSRQPGVTSLRLRRGLQQQETEALTCSGENGSRVSDWGRVRRIETLHFVHDNQSADMWKQTQPFRPGCGRWDACGGRAASMSSIQAAVALRRRIGEGRGGAAARLYSSHASPLRLRQSHTEAAAAAAWLCRRNFKNRSRVWGERRGRSASK